MSEIITALIPCDWQGKNVQEVVLAATMEARWKLEYDLHVRGRQQKVVVNSSWKSFHYLLEVGRLLFRSGFALCHPVAHIAFVLQESVAQHLDKKRTVALTTCSQHESLGGCGVCSKLCALHDFSNNCCSCKVVLSLQTISLRADTESDWHCRTEWGWLARLHSVLLIGREYQAYWAATVQTTANTSGPHCLHACSPLALPPVSQSHLVTHSQSRDPLSCHNFSNYVHYSSWTVWRLTLGS